MDGLRCLSIVAVVWHHTAAPSIEWSLAKKGHHGVTLFFAISGFLITTLLLRERDRYGTIALRDFYVRRSLRIFPLYYTVIVVYAVLVLTTESQTTRGQAFFEHLPYFLTYTSNWFVQLSGTSVIFYFAWSLATEEQFYLVWPSIERAMRGLAVPLALVAIVASAFVSHLMLSGQIESSLPAVIVASIQPSICFGVILAHLLHGGAGFAFLQRCFGSRYAVVVVGAALAFALAYEDVIPHAGVTISALCAALVATCVLREDNAIAPLMRWRGVVWIGKVSYGLYLLHMLCANAVKRLVPDLIGSPLLYFVVTLGLGVAVASLSFVYYESYFLRLKRRFER